MSKALKVGNNMVIWGEYGDLGCSSSGFASMDDAPACHTEVFTCYQEDGGGSIKRNHNQICLSGRLLWWKNQTNIRLKEGWIKMNRSLEPYCRERETRI